MASHFLVFLNKCPASFEELQEIFTRLNQPTSINDGGVFETTYGMPISFAGENINIDIALRQIDDMPQFFRSLKPVLMNKSICIDFVYASDWREACCCLIFCLALAKEYDALVYNDFQSQGFMTIEDIEFLIEDFKQSAKTVPAKQSEPWLKRMHAWVRKIFSFNR